jgi:L-fuculose-phosphate aldolase
MAVIHTHPIHSVIFSITGKPIVPVVVHGAIFGKGVPVHNHVGHINSRELGNELASVLGNKQAVLMKMHGAVIVGPSIERAFAYSLYLEDNAEKQLLGEISGSVIAMTPEEIKRSLRVAFGDLSILKRWQFYGEKEKKALGKVD